MLTYTPIVKAVAFLIAGTAVIIMEVIIKDKAMRGKLGYVGHRRLRRYPRRPGSLCVARALVPEEVD